MLDKRIQMVTAGIAGLVFVALGLVSNFIAGVAPETDAPVGEIRDFLADNRTALLWGNLLAFLAVLPIAWFIAVLVGAMRRATGDWLLSIVVVIAIVSIGAVAVSFRAVIGGLIWSEDLAATASDELVTHAWNTAGLMRAAGNAGFVVFLAATALAVTRTKMMPVGVGWLAAVGAVLAVVGAFSALGATLGTLAFAGFVSFQVWIIVVSIMMLTGKVAGEEVTAS